MQIGAVTVENSMELPQKIENVTAWGHSNSTSGNISKETQNTTLKEYMNLYVHSALFTIAKISRQAKCPSVDKWIKMQWYIYTIKYYLTIKNEWNLTICNSMNGPRGFYAKLNKSDRDIKIPSYFTYMWTLKNKHK